MGHLLSGYYCHSGTACCRKVPLPPAIALWRKKEPRPASLLPSFPPCPPSSPPKPHLGFPSQLCRAASEYPSFHVNEEDSLWPSFHCSPSSSHQLWRFSSHRQQLEGAEESSLVAKELQESLHGFEFPLISIAENHRATTSSSSSSSSSLVAMPFSLRMLQRKQSYGRGRRSRQHDSSNSSEAEEEPLQSALSSLLSMMETLHTCMIGDNLRVWVYKETHQSFLWLFRQVFSCSPHLMLMVMLLLVNFTAFSIAKTPSNSPPPPSTPQPTSLNPSETLLYLREYTPLSSPSCPFDQTSNRNSFSFSNNPTTHHPSPNKSVINRGFEHQPRLLKADMDMAAPPLNRPITDAIDNVLGSDIELVVPSMVAPLSVRLEPDNYLCYDRTELDYQYAISSGSANPLLLSNYAYFLYTVRHDHRRAIEFYRRALIADPSDGEVNGRFATFLWLGCGDIAAADKAYQASISADPNNPFYIGSYTHFLWHAGDKGKSCPITPTA